MHTTTDFLDEVKDRLNLPSDYALAGALGVTRAAVSKLRNGKDSLGDTTALKVAELLDVDPATTFSGWTLGVLIDEAHRRDAAGGPSGGADCSAAAGQEKGD